MVGPRGVAYPSLTVTLEVKRQPSSKMILYSIALCDSADRVALYWLDAANEAVDALYT